MNVPLVSIIIPIYNMEKYIKRCIESVLDQTYENIEIILINDGSTDKSSNIINEYALKDSRIKILHKLNEGVSASRNLGIDISVGDYLMFVDADDYLEPNCVEQLYHDLKNNEADISNGIKIYNGDKMDKKNEKLIWKNDEAIINSLKDHPSTFSVWGKIYSRHIIGQTRFRADIKVNEDSLFVFELCLKSPVFSNISEKLYNYEVNLDSVSHSKYSKKFEDIITVSEIKYNLVKERKPQYINLAENMRLKAYMNLLKNLAIKENNRYKLEKSLIKNIKQNKQFYISMNNNDDKWLFIVTHNLYYLYKLVYKMKKGLICSQKGFLNKYEKN